MSTKNVIYLLFLLLLTSLSFFYYFVNQQSLDYSLCALCDGNQYLAAHNHFNSSAEFKVNFPFNQRIFVPFLASVLPYENVLLNFHFLNFVFLSSSVVLLFLLWKKLNISNLLIFIAFFWMIFHWTGAVRLNIFDPITVDLPLYFFHTLLLILVFSKNQKWILFLAPLATIQKESFVVYLLIYFCYALLHNKLFERHFNLSLIFSALVLSIAVQVVVNYFYPPLKSGNSLFAVLFYVKQILLNPLILVRWTVAVFTAYGAFIILSLFNFKLDHKANPENNLLLIFTIISLLLGFIAGGDFTRIVFLGFPFVMTWVLIRLEQKSVLMILLALILSIPLMRLTAHIPLVENQSLHSWYPEFASYSIVAMWSVYMILSYIIISKIEKFIS